MRQIVTIVLLVIFTMPIVPLAQSESTESKLPPCCRKDGKHKCGMAQETAAKSGSDRNAVKLRAGKVPCSSWPGSNSEAATTFYTISDPATVLMPPPPMMLDRISQTKALYFISYSRSRQKRGPPVSHS